MTVYGIQFRPSGQIYFFSSGGFELAVNDAVVVNTDQGESLGWVVQVLANPPEHVFEMPVEPGVPGLPDNADAPDKTEARGKAGAPEKTDAPDSEDAPRKDAASDDSAASAGSGAADGEAFADADREATPAQDAAFESAEPARTDAGTESAPETESASGAASPDADMNAAGDATAQSGDSADIAESPEAGDPGAKPGSSAGGDDSDPANRNIKPVTRKATQEDFARLEENKAIAAEARFVCRRHIQNLKLDMKLVDVDIFLDRSKYIFYFTAPNRIDFRELVKELVRQFRTRIELRQIGVRNETQMVGGVGNCGMPCCCRRYIRKFAPVTIKMAKEQNLFLNPAKISGTCGRLLCCLAYEQSNYEEFHGNCPKFGKKYATTRGPMKVLRGNFFRNSLSVLNENNEEQEITLEEWQALKPVRPEAPQNAPRQPQSGEQGAERNAGNGTSRPENGRDGKNFKRPARPANNAASEALNGSAESGETESATRPGANVPDAATGAGTAGDPGAADTRDARDASSHGETGPAIPNGIFGLAPRRDPAEDSETESAPDAATGAPPRSPNDAARFKRKRKRRPHEGTFSRNNGRERPFPKDKERS